MREMKNSGIPWIGKIPKDWKISPIKYICKPNSIKIGPFGSALANKTFANEKYNVYGQANLVSGNFSATKNTVTKKTFNDLRNYEVLPDDICVSMMGTIGKCRIVPLGIKQGIMDSHLIKLRVENAVILPEFFLYVYDKDLGGVCFKQMQYEKTGSIMDGLNTSIVKRLYVTLPPVKEQHRITDYLDSKCAKIDSIKENVKAEIEALKQYKKSVITEAVTKGLDKNVKMKDSGIPWIGKIPKNWKITRLKYLGNYRNGLTYSPINICSENDGVLVLRSSNVQNGKIDLKDNVYVNIPIRSDMMVRYGDILICSRNGSKTLIGKNAIIDSNINASFGAFMMIYRCIDSRYLYYILNSSVFSYYIGSFFTSTINQLTGTNFGNIKIPFCPEQDERLKIITYLDSKCAKIDSIIQKKQELLANLDTYKKSLIYEYVTGKKEVPAV